MEQRLVKSRLEHLRNDEDAIRVFFKLFRYLCIRETIHASRCKRRLLPLVLILS